MSGGMAAGGMAAGGVAGGMAMGGMGAGGMAAGGMCMGGMGGADGGDCEDCAKVVKTMKQVRVPCHRNEYKQYTVKVPKQVTETCPQKVSWTDMEKRTKTVPFQAFKKEKHVKYV